MALHGTGSRTMASNLHRLQTQAEGSSGAPEDPQSPTALEPRMSPFDTLTAFGLPVYLLICSALTVHVLIEFWLADFWLLYMLFPGVNLAAKQYPAVQTLADATGGAVLGAVILCFRHLYKHTSQRSFSRRYVGFYLYGPWSAALLGITSYMLARGGLLVFAGGNEQAALGETSAYAYFALGILTGFGHERMLARVNALAKQIFGDRPTSR
jgi:hypothetical protein